MKGSINYLKKLRQICKQHKGDCKRCPLGNYQNVEDCRCPRLTHPETWTDEKIVDMVRV
jgi:hypothetical protein